MNYIVTFGGRKKREEKGTILKGLVLVDAILDDNRIGSSCILYCCIHDGNHGLASFDNL